MFVIKNAGGYSRSEVDGIVDQAKQLGAAGLVWATDSGWPDLIVGLCLAALLLRSAYKVTHSALTLLHGPRAEPVQFHIPPRS